MYIKLLCTLNYYAIGFRSSLKTNFRSNLQNSHRFVHKSFQPWDHWTHFTPITKGTVIDNISTLLKGLLQTTFQGTFLLNTGLFDSQRTLLFILSMIKEE